MLLMTEGVSHCPAAEARAGELERLVAERTAGLLEANQRLRDEIGVCQRELAQLRVAATDVAHGSPGRTPRPDPESGHAGAAPHAWARGGDVAEIDQYRRQVHQQAFFDSLTGLPNRLRLSERIALAIADAGAHGRQFGLMFLDLDRFKDVNDTRGHAVGDQLLCEAARRMLACVWERDTVARLGGDEFAILLPEVRQRGDLGLVAGKLLSQLAEPFVIDGRELFVTGSIGIAVYPDDSADVDALYRYADSAMYHAKKMGRNNYQHYSQELSRRSLERVEIASALRAAGKRGELVLHYQPQVDLRSGRVTGAEALLRWNRPGHGMVAPDRFIPVAEESELMVSIGEWVLRSACATAARWNGARAQAVKLSVNLSARQFLRNDLVGSVRAILADSGCRPEWLELEITESLLLEDSVEVIAMLGALHAMGLSISLDDFGTGYSALSYLNRFPVEQIKLDRSFVSGIPEQRGKCELVKAMLSIAVALGLESVAEGVETAEQAAYLQAHGCRLAQGYFFGKPMPLSEFDAMLADSPA
ncbi:EAL domain-containing protein [Pseudoduganella sp. LjRoot289]|uniref:putative bifunctional diguanylate cyclase/phosphodiesterase n=1 Tax=Pseudoduganella sp. LjRoot289 TaxID=3342314 RepID=UPI003ED0B777